MHRGEPSGATTDQALRSLVDAIVANHRAMFSKMISASPALATATFQPGATRQGSPGPSSNFFAQIGYYINSGDTALHFAAASYRPEMASELIEAGAEVRAKKPQGHRAVASSGSRRTEFAKVESTGAVRDHCGPD